MINLPFTCSCSELKVNPKNWLNPKASLKKDWYIFYRFYDPVYRQDPKFKYGKLIVLKGMNHFKSIPERQSHTQKLIDDELSKLKNKAYNPITGSIIEAVPKLIEITPNTSFIIAIKAVEKRISASPSTKRDLRSVLNLVSKASIQLGYSGLPINAISRKHFKQLLLHIDITEGESAHRYNKIRSYLMILYKELIEMEAVEINPLRDISKKKTILRLRRLPSVEHRKAINEYLYNHQYRFWLFMHIFFHSGARLTELMMVKRIDINLNDQFFIITIKKGTYYKEVKKPIKNIALQYWIEAIKDAEDDDYIFSKGLCPGKMPIQSFQITKRWNRHIKKKLGIDEDFYSLKHLNLDETAAILGINDAAAMASHSSTFITTKHYAVNELQRQSDRLKAIENVF